MARQKSSSGKSSTSTAKCLKQLQKLLDSKRGGYRQIVKATRATIILEAGIDSDDFLSFAEGRVDSKGNWIKIDGLKNLIDYTNIAIEKRLGISSNRVKNDPLVDILDNEQRLEKIVAPFFIVFAECIKSLQLNLLGQAPLEDFRATLTKVKKEYSSITSNYGLFGNCEVKIYGKRLIKIGKNSVLKHLTQVNRGAAAQTKKGSICCQINMSCEQDTVDCGTFDYCEHDNCGVGDSDSPCWAYDSGGCNCKVEDT